MAFSCNCLFWAPLSSKSTCTTPGVLTTPCCPSVKNVTFTSKLSQQRVTLRVTDLCLGWVPLVRGFREEKGWRKFVCRVFEQNILINQQMKQSILILVNELAWKSRHFCGGSTTDFPAKWRLRDDSRNSTLTTRHCPDLGSASDWLKQIFSQKKNCYQGVRYSEVSARRAMTVLLFLLLKQKINIRSTQRKNTSKCLGP